MMDRKTKIFFGLNIFFFFLTLNGMAQGPSPAYYYNPATELPWAQCYVYEEGGSRQKIPFLPVVSIKFQRAPLGIGNYSQDIDLKAPVVFVGNGIVKENVWNCYKGRRNDYSFGEIDIKGKIVMFCYDFPDKLEEQLKKEFPVTKRILEAVARKASGVLLFSWREEHPFLTVSFEKETDIPNIPVITIGKNSIANIFQLDFDAGGDSLFKKWEESGEPPQAMALNSKVCLRIEGHFATAKTNHFLFRARNAEISKDELKQIAVVNENSIPILFNGFNTGQEPKWKKNLTVYFRDFDSKFFYSHHWGWGKAAEEGVFMIHGAGIPDLGLAVHENAHVFMGQNWGDSSSFMSEGAGRYAQALATEKDRNHLQTIEFLKQGNLFPLEDMAMFNIGAGGLKTEVAYPASGSFVGFLIEKYGLEAFKEAYILEGRSPAEKNKADSWQKAFQKSLKILEKEWLDWLAKKYKVENKYLTAHFEKLAKEKKPAMELDVKILDSYVGRYELPGYGTIAIDRENHQLYFQFGGMERTQIFPESETKFTAKTVDATIIFMKNAGGEIERLMINYGGNEMPAKKVKG